ncbi:MAG TPA: pyridoxal phosphate-dependent aminotransferase [Tissierellia bacterium]|nr:pyridoxal phosphate-dependent aminotransferase [Tissierellia bacterium]
MKSPYISKRYWNLVPTAMGASGDLLKSYDDLINFSLGDPDITTDERIIQAAFEDAKAGHTHYTNFYGDPELRAAIRDYFQDEYGYQLTTEEILVTTSACHGMWLVMEAILDDGDEVIIPSPFFTPYPQQIRLARGVPVMLELEEAQDYQYDVKKLRSLITNRTKAILINSPHNPTGSSLSKKTLMEIAEVAIEHDLLVIADDIYTKFSFTEPFLPITTLPGMKQRTITLGSFSKNYAMTGWRVGYILSTPGAIDVMKNINEANVFTAPSISQRAAIHALALRDEIQPPMIEEFRHRVFTAYERIQKLNNMSVLPPKGTFYLFPNIQATGLSSVEVADRILKEAHVLVLPGSTFGANGEGYLRFAVTVGIDTVNEAFDRIEKMDIFR